MQSTKIPDIIVGRIPRYLRALENLSKEKNTTSSKELGDIFGYSAAQIRKDFSQFGGFGKQGTGYDIDFLITELKNILNINRSWEILLVGVGNIGRAILSYPGFSLNGFHVIAALDSDPAVVGEQIGKCTVEDISKMETIIKERNLKIAMLAVPSDVAQETSEKLVSYGIKAILTYAPAILNLPQDIRVEYSDPIVSLQHMTYYLS